MAPAKREEQSPVSNSLQSFSETKQNSINQSINRRTSLTHKISQHRQGSDAETAERSRRGDVPVQLVNHGLFAVSSHDHLLFLQLFGNLIGTRRMELRRRVFNGTHPDFLLKKIIKNSYILGAGSRHVNPRFGEECARSQHENDVDRRVDGIHQDVAETFRGRKVVAQSADGITAGRSTVSILLQKDDTVDSQTTDKCNGPLKKTFEDFPYRYASHQINQSIYQKTTFKSINQSGDHIQINQWPTDHTPSRLTKKLEPNLLDIIWEIT